MVLKNAKKESGCECPGMKLKITLTSIASFPLLYWHFADLAAPQRPIFSSDQLRAVLLHHRFSCFSPSWSPAGSILLIHLQKKTTNITHLLQGWCIKSFPSACQSVIPLETSIFTSDYSHFPSSVFHPPSIHSLVLPLLFLSLRIPVSFPCLAVVCIFSGGI